MAQTLAAERQREIVAIVDREQAVRVTNLASFFQVTEETIRRDLEKLEVAGKLVRSHGGALSIVPGIEAPASERDASFISEKVAIAREAVKFIKPDDTILIDASTTALYLARLMVDMPLTVITNSIQVCAELATRPRIRVICTGGNMSPLSLSFVGPRAEQMLADYRVNRLFFSCTAIDVAHGVSDTNEMQAALRQAMMAVSDERYLMVDRSKFGFKALKRFASVTDMSTVITNDNLDPALLRELIDSGIDVALAKTQTSPISKDGKR
jgi:DeoR/GlpR family transcriptional regulator of sugar metabolism